MTDETIELPPEISDEDAFEFAASMAYEVERMLLHRDADTLRYLFEMAVVEARRLAVAAAKARRDRTAE